MGDSERTSLSPKTTRYFVLWERVRVSKHKNPNLWGTNGMGAHAGVQTYILCLSICRTWRDARPKTLEGCELKRGPRRACQYLPFGCTETARLDILLLAKGDEQLSNVTGVYQCRASIPKESKRLRQELTFLVSCTGIHDLY